MGKAIGYVRVSTLGQVKDGYSLSYQVEEIQKYAARHNLDLQSIYEDKGISGAKVDDPESHIIRTLIMLENMFDRRILCLKKIARKTTSVNDVKNDQMVIFTYMKELLLMMKSQKRPTQLAKSSKEKSKKEQKNLYQPVLRKTKGMKVFVALLANILV